jgi:hypothetical protein
VLAVGLVYVGLIVMLAGVVSVVKPLRFVGIDSRVQGVFVAALGLLTAGVGWAFPAREVRVTAFQTQLDQFAPVYQFHEVHSIRVMASKDRVYRAIKSVTADDILFFRTLTWLRRLGRPGPENILNASGRSPLLDVATHTGFLLLADEPGREIVIGSAVMAPRGWRPKRPPTPEDFKAIRDPGFAIATMNFLVEDAGHNACAVTTETRVYASARRRFAIYWRVIYPGSALIRRMWLRAVKQRAEAPRETHLRSTAAP